jgi:hypothetical protein
MYLAVSSLAKWATRKPETTMTIVSRIVSRAMSVPRRFTCSGIPNQEVALAFDRVDKDT